MRITSHRSPWVAGWLAIVMAIPPSVLLRAQAKPAAAPAQAKPAASAAPPPGTNADTGWPRKVALKSGTAVRDQLRVQELDRAKGNRRLVRRLLPANWSKGTGAGSIKIQGATQVAVEDRVVRLDRHRPG